MFIATTDEKDGPSETARFAGRDGATARRHTLARLAAVAALPWWAPALDAVAQVAASSVPPLPPLPSLPSLPSLSERVRDVKVERGGLSLDIPRIAETGTSVPIVLFVDPSSLGTRHSASGANGRFGTAQPASGSA